MRETAVRERISSDSAAMEAAIRCWQSSLSNKSKPPSAPLRLVTGTEDVNPELNEKVTKLLRMLVGVLLSGKEDAIRGIGGTLEVFYRYVGGDPADV